MKKLLSLISLLLILSMTASLAGCHKDDGSESTDPSATGANATASGSNTPTAQTIAAETGYGYIAAYDNIPEGIDNINNIASYNGKYYVIGYTYDEKTYESQTVFFSMNPDGTGYQELPLPESEYNMDINYVKFDASGNVWLLAYEYYYPEYDGGIVEPLPADDGAVVYEDEASAEGDVTEDTGDEGVTEETGESTGTEESAAAAPEAVGDVVSNAVAARSGSVSVAVATAAPVAADTTDETVDETADATDDDTTDDTTDEASDETADEASDDTADAESAMSVEKYNLAIASGDYSGLTDSMERYVLYKCDLEGNILLTRDLSDLKAEDEDYIWFNTMELDGSGNIYLDYDSNIFVLDSNAELLFKISTDYYFNSMCATKDGKVLCTYWGDMDMECSYVDLAAKALGESVDLGESSSNYSIISPGDSGYDLLLNNSDTLFGYDVETAKTTPILNWLDCDINGYNLGTIYAVSDSAFVLMTYDDATGSQLLVTLNRVPASEIPVRTIITYAYTDYLDYNIRNAILSFNRQNTTYRISTLDYSKYNTDEDYTLGATRLSNDIIAGNVPDLVSCSSIDISKYTEKGLFLDLYTLIDKDTEITRDSFVDGVLKSMEIDGKLYTIGTSFYIQTAMGLSEVVGDNPGWTLDEMMAAYKKLGSDAKIMRYMTRDYFLTYCISMSYNSYIDKDTGECHFDGEDFISLLNLAAAFPKEYDDSGDVDEKGSYIDDNTLLAQHKILLVDFYLSSFDDMDYYRAYLNGQDFTFVGYPCSTRNGNVMNFDAKMAVSATSQSTEGIWQFMKYMLSEDYQENSIWQFPVIKTVFDKKKQEAMEPDYYLDENGEKVYTDNTWYINDVEVTVKPMTEAEIQKVLDVISNSTSSYTSDETIMGIIKEEAASFFDGQKTAQDVASLIQNRVQTYVMENR